MLASASTDGTVRLWNAGNGELITILNGGAQSPNAVLFSPDSKRIATLSPNATIRLWEPQTGKMIAIIQDCYHGAIAFSPDSSTLVSSQGSKNSIIRLWETNTGKQKAELDAKLDNVMSVVFSPDGSKIVTTEDLAEYDYSMEGRKQSEIPCC